MKCRSCGETQPEDTAKFCFICGSPISLPIKKPTKLINKTPLEEDKEHFEYNKNASPDEVERYVMHSVNLRKRMRWISILKLTLFVVSMLFAVFYAFPWILNVQKSYQENKANSASLHDLAQPIKMVKKYYQLITAKKWEKAFALRSKNTSSFEAFKNTWSTNNSIAVEELSIIKQTRSEAIVKAKLISNENDGVISTYSAYINLSFENGSWKYNGGDFKKVDTGSHTGSNISSNQSEEISDSKESSTFSDPDIATTSQEISKKATEGSSEEQNSFKNNEHGKEITTNDYINIGIKTSLLEEEYDHTKPRQLIFSYLCADIHVTAKKNISCLSGSSCRILILDETKKNFIKQVIMIHQSGDNRAYWDIKSGESINWYFKNEYLSVSNQLQELLIFYKTHSDRIIYELVIYIYYMGKETKEIFYYPFMIN